MEGKLTGKIQKDFGDLVDEEEFKQASKEYMQLLTQKKKKTVWVGSDNTQEKVSKEPIVLF